MKRSLVCNFVLVVLALGLLVGCTTERPIYIVAQQKTAEAQGLATATALPERPVYSPGTIVEYIAQSGDTLPLLAARFGSSVQEIRIDNPQIPEDATTMPPGFPMKMRIYYKPFWGSQYQIIPDAAFVNGPDAVDFDVKAFIETTPGWFKTYETYIQDQHRDAVELIRWLSENYSLNPKLLLTLIEFQTGALSNPERTPATEDNFLGNFGQYQGVYLQLYYVGDRLNDAYYRFRTGDLLSFEHLDGKLENVDPWQNAATVSLQYYFSQLLDGDDYRYAIGPDGFAKTFQTLFGDPWRRNTTVLPGSLRQPELILPFRQGTTWAYTGGPHTGWGSLRPYAAIDFAPPTETQGCVPTNEYSVAMADGIVARTDIGTIMLDLDGDGDERTGWVILYLHLAEIGRLEVGTRVSEGDPLGKPSCEGGNATGTHVHIARKYNGEWIPAASYLPFNLSGWVPVEGSRAYEGTLVRGDEVRIASVKSETSSLISSD